MTDHDPTGRFSGGADRYRSVRGLQAAGRYGGGLYLGKGAGGWAWSGPQQCLLVLGPARSGKTSSIIIPNVLSAPGAVVSTSTKPELLEATARSRAMVGWVALYDPTETVATPPGVARVGWSPVSGCDDWDHALQTARGMVRAARLIQADGGAAPSIGDHWTERATALLSPLLHAGAIADAPFARVLSWVDRHEGDHALAILAGHHGEDHPATNVLKGILTTDERELSGIWSTASGVLAAYRSPAVLRSTEPPLLDAAGFCEGANTLYVCASGQRQELLAPLLVGMLSDLRDATYARAAEGQTSPPLLLALDEAANIAPLPDLPSLVTEGAGQGLITIACFQDLSQARARWGRHGDAFLSLFGTTVVLPGIADRPTLEALSALGGDEELEVRTTGRAVGAGGRIQPSVSVSTVFRRRLPVDVIARGARGAALCVDARNRIGWVELTPAHRAAPWSAHLLPDRPRGVTPPARRNDQGRAPRDGWADHGRPAGADRDRPPGYLGR